VKFGTAVPPGDEVRVPDFITCAKFSDNRFRGFGDSGGSNPLMIKLLVIFTVV